MRLGIAIQETWSFFNEIYTELTNHYQTTLFMRRTWKTPFFRERLNRRLYYHDLNAFLRNNDVVFFEWASGLLATASHMPKSCGIVTRLHRYEMYEWVDRINWDVVDKIILVSHAKKREFIEKFPDQTDKIIVTGPSTSLEKFTPQPKKYHGDIGILCHLTPRKRVYDLILTFYELTKVEKNFHLHIGGGHDPAFLDYFVALKHLVRKLNLDDKVTFYGNVTDTPSWYHNIDIFISNSYSEGLQVAPMEAMASGCFTLVHQWDGADELLPEGNLFFTGSELLGKILNFSQLSSIQKNVERTRMRAIACERFDMNNTISQINQAIDVVAASY